MGIGAGKAGTTWHYERLREHPSVSFPAGKKVGFQDRQHGRGLDWYRRLFEVGGGELHGEIARAYAILDAAQGANNRLPQVVRHGLKPRRVR